MGHRTTTLFLDSLAIGVVASSLILSAGILYDIWGLAGAIETLGRIALGVLWLQLAVFLAPLATLVLLARMSD